MRHKLNGHDQRRGQRAARFIKHQKGKGKAACNPARSAQNRGPDQQGKVFCPKGLFQRISPQNNYPTGYADGTGGCFETYGKEKCSSAPMLFTHRGKFPHQQ